MNISITRQDGDLICVTVGGDISQKDLALLDEPLAGEAGPDVYEKKVLINLGKATMLDSSGVNWLLHCHKRFEKAGGKLVLHSTPPLVRNVIRVLRMDRVFTLADNEADAKKKAQETTS